MGLTYLSVLMDKGKSFDLVGPFRFLRISLCLSRLVISPVCHPHPPQNNWRYTALESGSLQLEVWLQPHSPLP